MIDEKKLIEDLTPILNKINAYEAGRIIGCIDIQENKCSECSRRKFYQQGYQDGLNAGKWIPCEERLPSEEMEVWVTHENGKVLRHYWYNGQFVQNYPLDEPRPYPKAIAWMPCIKPQPYKKEGAENE